MESLYRIASALGTTPQALFGAERPEHAAAVVRAGDHDTPAIGAALGRAGDHVDQLLGGQLRMDRQQLGGQVLDLRQFVQPAAECGQMFALALQQQRTGFRCHAAHQALDALTGLLQARGV